MGSFHPALRDERATGPLSRPAAAGLAGGVPGPLAARSAPPGHRSAPPSTLHFGVPSFLADVGPFRRYPPYRRLLIGQLVSGLGSQLTIVGVAFQAYELTHSSLVVGLVSVAQLAPNLIGSLGGGSLADAMDRRTVLVLAQIMLALGSGALAANAFLPHPTVWALFVATCASAAFQGLDWPTRTAIMPMILPKEDLPSAFALQSLIGNGAMVAGPALAGLCIARFGLGATYSVDVASFAFTLVAAAMLPALAPVGGGTPVGVRAVRDGLRYLRSERLLSAALGLDFVAMSFGMPKAVFPALGVTFFHGGATTVGLLFAAPGAGALVGSVFSGWVRRIRHQPRALVVCMLGWGGAITCFGVFRILVLGLFLLGVAGATDAMGTVFRVAILQAHTPAEMMGRLSGSFYAAAVAGNRVGDGESGAVAALAGAQVAVWTGGVACLVGTVLYAWRVPELWRRSAAVPGGRPLGAVVSIDPPDVAVDGATG